MDFVANFMENTTVKKLKIGQHLSNLYDTVFIKIRCRGYKIAVRKTGKIG